jgi:aquaporin Z
MYWIAQIVGGTAGALVGGIIGGATMAPSSGKGVNFMQAFLAELVFVAILCFVVLAVATSNAAENNSWYGLAIGFTVFAGAVSVGGISGGSFNPAVTMGLSVVKGIHKFAYALWMIAAQFAGAFLGAFAYYMAAPTEFTDFSAHLGELASEGRSLLPGSSN